MGEQTVSPIAMDPLTWHVALALAALALAFLADYSIKTLLPGKYSLPLFAFSMLAGLLIQKTLDWVGLGQFVDKAIMGRIGSSTSDFLIAFGVASIKLSVVLQYWQPLLVMSLFGVAYSVILLWFIGRRIFRNFWFERSVFVYGWNTGVVAIGITLLRVVDPRLKTRTLEEFGLAYVLISWSRGSRRLAAVVIRARSVGRTAPSGFSRTCREQSSNRSSGSRQLTVVTSCGPGSTNPGASRPESSMTRPTTGSHWYVRCWLRVEFPWWFPRIS